jgi:hypothetical protein
VSGDPSLNCVVKTSDIDYFYEVSYSDEVEANQSLSYGHKCQDILLCGMNSLDHINDSRRYARRHRGEEVSNLVQTADNRLGKGCETERRPETNPPLNNKTNTPDERDAGLDIQMGRLKIKYSLCESEKHQLLEILSQHREHFTKIPGKCNACECKFQMQGGIPRSRTCRAIQFALRNEVRD